MKAQKLGLVLGMNMAVACLVLQGCKANKPGNELPPPVAEPIAEQSTTTTTTVETIPESGQGQTAVPQNEPAPMPQTAKVKPLPPPPPAKPATAGAKKPAATADGEKKTSAADAATVHTVQRGEFLSTISKKYNVKMSAIVDANPGLNPNRIRIGQKLKIPGSTAAPKSNVMLAAAPAPGAAPAAAANTSAPVKPAFKPYAGPTTEYVVKSGDSLGKIAYENGITIRALKEMNGLSKDIVRVGQKLKVPAEKVEKAKEAPKDAKKDVKDVAKDVKKDKDVKEAAAPAEPATAAAPEPEKKAAPNAEAAAPAATEAAAAAPVEEQKPAEAAPAGNTYVVKAGEDIVAVSIKWGISPSQLLNANDMKEGEQLHEGQVLKLPPNAKQAVQ